ncbi:MAG: hypothetical protein AB7G06_05255 [Bdellovibrionales bacterium]
MNRPTDESDFDNSDDEAAAFGDHTEQALPAEDDPAVAGDDDIAEQYDDSDFVTDDAEDVVQGYEDESYTAATDADYTEELADQDELYDPLADDGDPYPNAEEIYDQQKKSAGGKFDFLSRFGSMKTTDMVFYGGGGLALLGALYFAFTMTMSKEPSVEGNLLNAPASAVAQNNQAPVMPDMQIAAAPTENPPEPKPDVIGIQGAQSTLATDTMAPLPEAVPDAPPSDIAQLHQPVVEPAPIPAIEPAPVPGDFPSPQAAIPPAPDVPLPTNAADAVQMPTEVQNQLAAQNQAMQDLQTQLEVQKRLMEEMQKQAMTAPLTQVTAPPPIIKSDDPAVNQLATDMSVRIAEMNARMTQLNDNIAKLETANKVLAEQNTVLQAKTKELNDKLGSQSSKLTELANKEPPPSTDKAMIATLKSEVEQLQKKLNAIPRAPATTAPQQQPAQAQVTVKQAPSSAATARQPAQQQPKPQAVMQSLRPAEEPPVEARSPKTRDLAGLTHTAPTRITWVLRAATPSMAWLSPRPGSAELKRVAPGDTVEGIGQILEIRQEAGKWAVIGTLGIVR